MKWNEETQVVEYEHIVNDAVIAAAKAIAKVYGYDCQGGNLHIAVDDGNLEDHHLDSCEGYINENAQHNSAAQLEAERFCLTLLRPLSEDERFTATVIEFQYREVQHG